MRSSKLLSVVAAASMVAMPVLAAAPTYSNPAASLALPSAAKVRASDRNGRHNNILGLPLLAVLAAAAAVTAVAVVAADSGSDSG
jgi:hypothetical protein